MKYLKWAAVNIPLYALLVAGVLGSQGAMNVVWFFVLFMVVIYALVVGMGKTVYIPPEKRIPNWLHGVFDVAFLFTAIWFSHWVLAIMYIASQCLQWCIIKYDPS